MRDLVRWMLVVGGISVFDITSEDEEWMQERWRADLDDLNWDEAKERLRKIMWIDVLQDTMPDYYGPFRAPIVFVLTILSLRKISPPSPSETELGNDLASGEFTQGQLGDQEPPQQPHVVD